MFCQLSSKAANWLEQNGIISSSDRELYEYGLRQMFITILNILTTLLIGLALGMILQAVVFILTYIPVRIYAGGFHASNPQRCWLISAIMLLIVLCILKYMPKLFFQYISALSLIAGVMIALISPVEDLNKPLDDEEKRIYHLKVIIIILFEIVMAIILYFLKFNNLAITIEMVWITLSLMLIAGKLKNCIIVKKKSGGST